MGACVMENYYPDDFLELKSLVLFHGYSEIGSHYPQYKEKVKRLGSLVRKKLEEDLKKTKQKLFTVNEGDLDKEINIYQEKSSIYSNIYC